MKKMMNSMIENHPSYIYAKKIVDGTIKPPALYYELNGDKKFIPLNQLNMSLMKKELKKLIK